MHAKALKAAFPHTLPVLAGFWFVGLAYGLYMNVSGFSFWYPLLMSLIVYGGSLQFVMVPLLLSPFAPLQAFFLALLIQARHIFYGISMLEKYRDLGWKRFYLIFSLCDETFSVNYAAEIPQGVDRGWFYLYISSLNHLFWVTASALGGLVGSILPFETQGLEFVLTALFVVILLDQWRKERQDANILIGLLASLACLLLLGPDHFLLPAMLTILTLLLLFRPPLKKRGDSK
ncbi:MAG TPA: AzlC family ABC transporter permease [Clostridia bacterium]|nr:branched-chain amino acid transporter AzlC [Clostridiaceae bacterium]HZK42348.1 AzlC family ABC transporter permease [Clostridia bacterium]